MAVGALVVGVIVVVVAMVAIVGLGVGLGLLLHHHDHHISVVAGPAITLLLFAFLTGGLQFSSRGAFLGTVRRKLRAQARSGPPQDFATAMRSTRYRADLQIDEPLAPLN